MATLLTVYEAAEYLKISPQQVRKMIRKKVLPAAKIGREYRITEENICLFLISNTTI